MKIIETVQINGKNTRNTKTGKKVLSLKLYPLDIYLGGIFLPEFIQEGDVVTVYVDQIEVGEYNGNPQYNAKFAKVTKEMLLSSVQTAQNNASVSELFGGSETAVSDDELPF